MERVRATPESYARKIEFIETAMAEGAHNNPSPKSKKITRDGWDRELDIGLLYNVGPETTAGSIGFLYGLTRERIGKISRQFIIDLHSNCSLETQDKFPLRRISFDKPLLQVSREKRSLSRGGISLRIKQEIESGVNDLATIAQNLGLSEREISMHGRVLRGWGIILPRKTVSVREIREMIRQEGDDKKLQELLDSFSPIQIRGSIERERNIEQSTFVFLGKFLFKLGFSFQNAQFMAKVLKSIGIPIRIVETGYSIKHGGREYPQRFYVFYAKHKQRITDAVKVMEAMSEMGGVKRLRKTKTELVCGEVGETMSFPSTFELRHRKNFESVGNLILETTGIYVEGRRQRRILDFLSSNCSIPVFRYMGSYFFPSSKKEEFRAFIKKRYMEIVSAKA
ncbi:MAG: hypothetical protein Q7R31_03775 [Candidatus Levybacteria bacterium]|nr:hypothetical protein [Candidatus Levybacteria bacterium]